MLIPIEAWDICGDHAVFACPEHDEAGQEDPLCRTVTLVSAEPEAAGDSGGEDTGTAG